MTNCAAEIISKLIKSANLPPNVKLVVANFWTLRLCTSVGESDKIALVKVGMSICAITRE